jgi:hypothetical protein
VGRGLIGLNYGNNRFDYDGSLGGTVSEGFGEEPSGVGAAVLGGAQFCGASGLRGFGWQLVPAPVDSNRIAWYVVTFLK